MRVIPSRMEAPSSLL